MLENRKCFGQGSREANSDYDILKYLKYQVTDYNIPESWEKKSMKFR